MTERIRIRMSNRLRAIKAREMRRITIQTLTGGVVREAVNPVPRGPYAKWLPERQKR